MVSINCAKRYPIDIDKETSTKKTRLSSYMDPHTIVSLNPSFHSENMSRLRDLFPFKPIEELSNILEKSADSFDYAIFLIQKQEEEKTRKAANIKKAQDMVMALSSVSNINQAVEIALEYIDKPSEEPSTEEKTKEENNVLRNHIVILVHENKLLKKTFRKLLENSKGNFAKDQQIEKLNKELEIERIKSYYLSIQLNQAINTYKINPNRELF